MDMHCCLLCRPSSCTCCSYSNSCGVNCYFVPMQPCAKVWASGFASALLPRRSSTSEFRQNVYAWMECFFEQWLKGSPGVRLQQLASVLQTHQTFPQLYIYSESDHVVPHTSVEAFMKVGCERLGCNLTVWHLYPLTSSTVNACELGCVLAVAQCMTAQACSYFHACVPLC